MDQSLEDEKSRGQVCSLDNEQSQAIVEQNSQQSAKEMFEILFKYPVNEAVAVLTAGVSVSVTDGLWHFVEDFAQKFAYNCLQLFIVKTAYLSSAFFIFKALIHTTEFLELPLYCPITCIPISPCSVDIGNSLEGIVTEFELMQHK